MSTDTASEGSKAHTSGSVLEFEFGPNPKSYFATSYPHPIREAIKAGEVPDIRLKV
jgi:hypothetical protein